MRGLVGILLLSVLSHQAFAAGGNKMDEGVKMELSLGIPSLTITNPDSTLANYKGLGAQAKGFIPIMTGDNFRTDLTAGFRYLDFENTANGTQSEYAQYLGPGAGLEIALSRFFVGADYYFLKARHTSVGSYSAKSEFTVSGLNYYAGVRMRFGLGSLGLAWSQMSSSIPGSEVGINGESKWSNSTYWIQFTYSFKTSTKGFFQSLFSN